MRIHVIQTGTVAIKQVQRQGRPSGNPIVNILRDPTWTEPLPIYAFVVEHPEGLIVVDTGPTARATEPGYYPAWHPFFRFGMRLSIHPEEEIGPQLAAIGFKATDVRWVVMTHLHSDHAGGLDYFPNSEILASERELADAAGRTGRMRGYMHP